MLDLVIRAAQPADFEGIFDLNAGAFATRAEAMLVDRLRAEAAPLVELVAVSSDTVVGHILFSPVTVAGNTSLMMGLAPLAVALPWRGQQIASTLVRDGLAECRLRGAVAAVVLGHAELYRQCGFVPAQQFGLQCEYDVPAENFLAIELNEGALRHVSGRVSYHPAFAAL